jgi:hypothetical protein
MHNNYTHFVQQHRNNLQFLFFIMQETLLIFIIKIIFTSTLLYKVSIVIAYKRLPNSRTTYNNQF